MLNDSIARRVPCQADVEMVMPLEAATTPAEDSDNTFNPIIGHLIRLCGFEAGEIMSRGQSPAEVIWRVDANLRMADCVFDSVTISSRDRRAMPDLAGSAKGCARERAAQILRAEHVESALIHTGGNILSIGQSEERPWPVAGQDPRGDGMAARLALHDKEAIGAPEYHSRCFMKDGKHRPHTMDSKTGEPTGLTVSINIITSGRADAGTRSDGNTRPRSLLLARSTGKRSRTACFLGK